MDGIGEAAVDLGDDDVSVHGFQEEEEEEEEERFRDGEVAGAS